MTLPTRIAASPGEIEALVPAWRALWQRTPAATAFQRPEWLLPWWQAFARERPPRVVAVEDCGELVGLVACRVREDDCGRQVLALLGEAVSDYLDGIARPEHEANVAAAFFRAAEQLADIDEIDLQELPEHSFLRDAPAPGWRDRLETHSVCPRVAVPAGATCIADVVPAKLAAQLAHARRKLDRRGAVSFARAERASVIEHLAAMTRMHRARWARRGRPGVLDAPGVQAFHADAATRLAACGMLELWTLSLDAQPIASVYALADRGRLRCYLGTFDPRLAACSPGALAIAHVVEQKLADGVCELDFLRGGEGWKYRWGAHDRQNVRRVLRR